MCSSDLDVDSSTARGRVKQTFPSREGLRQIFLASAKAHTRPPEIKSATEYKKSTRNLPREPYDSKHNPNNDVHLDAETEEMAGPPLFYRSAVRRTCGQCFEGIVNKSFAGMNREPNLT